MAVSWDQLATYTWDQLQTWDDPLPGKPLLPNVLGADSRVLLEFAFGADLTQLPDTWTFTDCTPDVRQAAGIAITKGRPDQASQAQPSTCKFTLANVAGKYTTRRALSMHYPYMRRDVPIRASVDPGTGRVERFGGFMDTDVNDWDISGVDPTVDISASGILRRLNQGDSPLRSPVYRATFAAKPTYYWAMEDSGSATFAAEEFGGPPMRVMAGEPVFGAQNKIGTVASVDFSLGGFMSASVSVGLPWRVAYVVRPLWDTEFPNYPLSWTTSNGSVWRINWQDLASKGGQLEVEQNGAKAISAWATPNIGDGNFHSIVVEGYQNGSTMGVVVYYDGAVVQHSGNFGNVAGITTNAGIRQVRTNFKDASGLGSDLFQVAHVALWDLTGTTYPTGTPVPGYDVGHAAFGYIGETVDDRQSRICAEENIPITITGTSDVEMGPQPIDTLINILRQGETTDGGVLGDGQNFGLTYQCRSARYNPDVAIALDIPSGQVAYPFKPTDDDHGSFNDVTYTQYEIDGSTGTSARFVDDDDVAAHGRYDTSHTVNTETADPLYDMSAWDVHVGTVDIERYPSIGINLVAAPEKIAEWLALGEGSRLTVSGKPAEASDGDVDNLVEGYSETITQVDWDATTNGSPSLPWFVFILETDRVDSGTSTLHANVTAGASSFQVNVGGKLWTTTSTFPTDFPLTVGISGIPVTVTGISGTSSPQTFTVNSATVVKDLKVGDKVSLWQPPAIAL